MLQSVKNYYHLLQAIIAVNRFNYPAKNFINIGVTGTDGKTTTSSLIYHILQETGHKTALISTVAAYIGTKKYDTGFHVSTPNSLQLQSYLDKALKAGMKYLVLEVTSHALDQHRVYGIPFRVGVLTNVTHEHLDYHKSMHQYLMTKAKLLKQAEVAILNRDDKSYPFLKEYLTGKNIITYGIKEKADVTPENHPFTSQLTAPFHTYNILAALAVCDALAIDTKKAAKAVTSFVLPQGRFDVVYKKDFTIIIDFAHTPNALRNFLAAVSLEKKKGRIIHVFGSAGERDRSKRPLMGKVASEYADSIILTAEDPRSESAEEIAKQILSGIGEKKDVSIIVDRQEAITKAISLARSGDYVVITGKGHEQSMNFGKGEVPWSDYKAVEKALSFQNR